MLSVFTLKLDYYIFKRRASNVLNFSNIEKISKNEIKYLDKKFNKELFTIYKRNLLSEYYFKNMEPTTSFVNKYKKLIKKFGINLTQIEEQKLHNLLNIELTSIRAFKSLLHPFKNNPKLYKQECFFIYDNVRCYEEKNGKLSLIREVSIYLLDKVIILYDSKDEIIIGEIWYEQIREIQFKKYGVMIYAGLSNSMLLRSSSNNEAIWISIVRMLKKFNSNHIAIRNLKNTFI